MPYRKIQNLEISSLAESDIEDIVQYTFVNHGLTQVDKYLDALMQAMELNSGEFRHRSQTSGFTRQVQVVLYGKTHHRIQTERANRLCLPYSP